MYTFEATFRSQKDQIISSVCKTLFSLNILCSKIEKFTISGVTKTNAIFLLQLPRTIIFTPCSSILVQEINA